MEGRKGLDPEGEPARESKLRAPAKAVESISGRLNEKYRIIDRVIGERVLMLSYLGKGTLFEAQYFLFDDDGADFRLHRWGGTCNANHAVLYT